MKKGFTLIELLVVLAIMGILMGILFIAYDGVRKSARDGKRKADLEQIRSALEMCRSDTGSYPSTVTSGSSISCGGQTYMSNVPTDPLSYSYTYVTPDSGVTYTLCAHLETGAATSNCSASHTCTGTCGDTCNYKTCNP